MDASRRSLHVYGKTSAGVQALAATRGALPAVARQLLILIDGKRTLGELGRMFAEETLTQTITLLETQGYIECLRHFSDEKPAREAPAPGPERQEAPEKADENFEVPAMLKAEQPAKVKRRGTRPMGSQPAGPGTHAPRKSSAARSPQPATAKESRAPAEPAPAAVPAPAVRAEVPPAASAPKAPAPTAPAPTAPAPAAPSAPAPAPAAQASPPAALPNAVESARSGKDSSEATLEPLAREPTIAERLYGKQRKNATTEARPPASSAPPRSEALSRPVADALVRSAPETRPLTVGRETMTRPAEFRETESRGSRRPAARPAGKKRPSGLAVIGVVLATVAGGAYVVLNPGGAGHGGVQPKTPAAAPLGPTGASEPAPARPAAGTAASAEPVAPPAAAAVAVPAAGKSAVAAPATAKAAVAQSGALHIRNQVMPELPEVAKAMGIASGKVVVVLHVNPKGLVERVEPVSATPPEIYDAAMEAAFAQWTFDPLGIPGRMTVEVEVKPPAHKP